MKLSLNWLKKYVSFSAVPEDLARRLTLAGQEVEKIHDVAGDTVFELEITPNRPDCLNVLGLARDVSAILRKPLKIPAIKNYPAKGAVDVSIEDKKDCGRYVATLIENVSIKDASREMKKLLGAMATRTINNVVDVTNFCLFELGQPLHAFDYDKLTGGKIVVRRAKEGETIVTIDGTTRKLDSSILVIADAKGPVAIAGVMGGKETEVTANTKRILLESAYFDMGLVRRAGRKLGLSSESSYRFERGVDFDGVLAGANRATDLILKAAGGKVSARKDLSQTKDQRPKTKITVTLKQIEDRLGMTFKPKDIIDILTYLGCQVAGSSIFKVLPPSFRNDLKEGVDLIEELARVSGFDAVPMNLPQVTAINITASESRYQRKKIIRHELIAQGFDEIVTLAMTNFKNLEKCNLKNLNPVKVFNPLSQDQELMRPSLLPSFLSTASLNLNRGQKDFKLFEIGKRYFQEGETETLGILAVGRQSTDWRNTQKANVDFYDIKGAVEQVLSRIKVSGASFKPSAFESFDPAVSAEIVLNEKTLGIIGKISPQVLSNWSIKAKDLYFAGLDLEMLLALLRETRKYQKISEYPAVVRDVSLAIDRDIPYSRVEEICRKNGAEILRAVNFMEEYLGDKIASDKRGIVFSLAFQSPARTLRDDEVEAACQQILKALVLELKATRR